MERHFKVKLTSGRVLGPLDLDRIRLLVAKKQITGVELARPHPQGEWQDINQFPELASILVEAVDPAARASQVEEPIPGLRLPMAPVFPSPPLLPVPQCDPGQRGTVFCP